MLHKAWNSKGEVPYCFPKSSIKFQGHTGQNITAFDPNWAFPDYRPVAAFKSLRFALLKSNCGVTWLLCIIVPVSLTRGAELSHAQLTAWYTIRACQIEALSRQVDNALDLVRLGISRYVHVSMEWIREKQYRLEIVSSHEPVQLTKARIGSDTGLVLNRRQAIILTNDGLTHWHICVTQPQWVKEHKGKYM